ncbi:methyltransferase [Sporanaerobium hydrogeniformans]|uniref:Methyltransferase n=1 Tax=Sporanaerobium hydrogeniformans TaxID=3072179 RepID=A0AC61DBL9_9FIRM|nr:O-methyltransferase [Sporanaerobium hydrogeniformans]PHV70636.1 methyltransferase [Sporanaerobium hydrogeniformans]
MSEISYSYIVEYIRALHTPPTSPVLQEIERLIAQGEEQWPIIKPEVADFFKVLLSLLQPAEILELGTAVGYSSILMSEFLKENGHITTIERFDYMYDLAVKNIEKAQLNETIKLLKGDAVNILPTLQTETYDIIFMDCAKGQYINFLPECIRLLKPNGLLITDNVLHKGTVARSRYLIERRQRTTHARLREYLWSITHSPELHSSVLPIGDGVALSYKIGGTQHDQTSI